MVLTYLVLCISVHLHVKEAGDLWPRIINIIKELTFTPEIPTNSGNEKRLGNQHTQPKQQDESEKRA